MQVKEILRVKGNRLLSIEPSGRAADAVTTMAKENLGSLVVIDQGRVVGMLTFHELLQAVAKRSGSLGEGRGADIMVRDPVIATPELEVNDLRRTMLASGARYLPVVQAAWEGVDPAQFWDSHAHLVGTGDSGAGVYVNPRMQSLMHPVFYVQREFFLDAACVGQGGSVDRGYVERMRALVDGLRPGAKLLLLGFERMHDDRGAPKLDRSTFYVPDAYTRDIARAYTKHFE